MIKVFLFKGGFMNKYVAVCLLFIQPVMIMTMDTHVQKRNKGAKKEVLTKFVALKRIRSKPIPIAGSGKLFIKERQPESPADIFKLSLSEQSYSPTVQDLFNETSS